MEFVKGKTFQQKSILYFNLNVIKLFGYWQPKNPSKSLQVLYGFYSFLIIVSAIFNVITESIDVISLLIAGDIDTFASNAYLYFLNFAYVIRAVHFHAFKKQIVSLIDAMDQQIFQPRTEGDMLFSIRHAKKWLLFCKAYIFCGIATVCFFIIFPFTDSNEIKLPFCGWYPVGDDWFVVLYLYQELQEFSLGMCNISFASIIMCILSYLSMQMDLLQNCVNHLKERCEEKLSARSWDSSSHTFNYQQELGKLINENLVDCICLHQTILRMKHDLEKIFSITIFSIFLFDCLILCMTMFQFVTVPLFSTQWFSVITYFTCIVLELFGYCWLGNELIIKSNNTALTLFHSDWNGTLKNYQTNVLIFLTLLMRPITVTAGYFTLTVDTFTAIMRTTWSYFVFLWQVYNRH
uniref:Odorant receptor n=1 Tax=Protaetia brevitarsis TaxID=348688 RepID=A0A411HR09_PROBE|nr:odorant receptor [Protaetia brevitarsis]